MLLRRVIGDVLRARRQDQQRTLREVSTAANVSLGYLSEIERGQKEASSELLAAICEALGSELSEVLRDASETLALSESTATAAPAIPEQAEPVLVPAADRDPAGADSPELRPAPAEASAHTITDGTVSVSVRRNGPLRTTLHAVRNRRPGQPRTTELTRPTG